MKYSYLLIDGCSVLIPFVYSFHKKILFYKSWKSLSAAIVLTAIPFLIWDELFTRWGVWGFDADYLTGIYIGHLPLEELLFFVCIPYACVFTYFCFKRLGICPFFNRSRSTRLSYVLSLALLLTGIFNYDKAYTATTFLLLSAFICWHALWHKPSYLPNFYFAYLVLLIPFFIVNGILTVIPIVWYNDMENLGIRMLSIPVEDTFYGMLLIMMNVSIFEYVESRSSPSVTL